MNQFWDQMYDKGTYGEDPNETLVENSSKITSGGAILSIGEGEGRNAVWLAKKGFRVKCVDISSVGLERLSSFAKKSGVEMLLTTEVADLSDFNFECDGGWDGIISIWCHLPSTLRRKVHASIVSSLKSRGVFIAEYYTPSNIGRGTGGPQNVDMCVTAQVASEELSGLDLNIVEKERIVSEGIYHNGLSAVIQIVGVKL